MSKIMMNNQQQKEGELNMSFVKTTHHGIKCDLCGKNPIIGYRYKCTICKNYNLCENCEIKNSETLEHEHNFIKMRNEEKVKEKKIEPKKENIQEIEKQKIININEVKVNKQIEKEYSYEIINKNELTKEVTEFVEKDIKYEIMIKNNNKLPWLENGKTKLINDKNNSDIKYDNIILNNLREENFQKIVVNLNIKDIRAGEKKIIFNFNVDGKNYGQPLILILNVKEGPLVEKMRKDFNLSKNDYDSKRLFEVIKKSGNDLGKAFESLFL